MAKGDKVKKGQMIGKVNPPMVGGTGPHVGLELRRAHHCDMCTDEPCCMCRRRPPTRR